MVALVEAADSFPLMLLALPAGALADIVDRRRLLIAIQVYLLAVAAALGVMTLLELTTAWVLIGFTFALGIGGALMMPAWASIVPDLVPAEDLPSAIALNSVAINGARAIGPAIAGVLVAAMGPWLVFMLNAISYVGILAALLRWRREREKSTLPAERFFSAIRVGMRFVTHARVLQMRAAIETGRLRRKGHAIVVPQKRIRSIGCSPHPDAILRFTSSAIPPRMPHPYIVRAHTIVRARRASESPPTQMAGTGQLQTVDA